MKNTIVVFFLLLSGRIIAQNFYTAAGSIVTLNNEALTREIVIKNDSLYCTSLFIQSDPNSFVYKSKEFSFFINGKEYNGFTGWKLIGTKPITDAAGGHGVQIIIAEKGNRQNIKVELNYLMYPKLPLIRKWINIINTANADIKIESVNVEELNTSLSFVNSLIYHNYGRMKHQGKFIGDWDDPVVVLHDISLSRGIALGNEAMGVLKRTAFHTGASDNIEIGLTRPGQSFPFRKWLKQNESWQSPKTFICLYNKNDDGFNVIDNAVNEFTVKYMQPKIIALKSKPVFVYNTWNPFRAFINDTLINEVAKAAAECGIQEFVIDDGWQINDKGKTSTKGWGVNYGDWLVDENKFHGGLKPTFDYIKSLGMKPGLWVSVASATKDAKVFKEHPEWFVKNAKGKPGNIHYESATDDGFYSASFGTGWYDYIKERIIRLVDEYGLAYAKLDLAVVTSPYVNNDSISGSYATNHPYYRDHQESFTVLYDRLLKLFDGLHTDAPELFIDCTFETAGKLQLMDYAIAGHAEGNWLSNFEEPSPVGPLRIRQMAWWRTPALPASSMVIGNQVLDDPDFEFCLKSLIGTLPMVLGDPRKISTEKRKSIKEWSVWMQAMQQKYDYMNYRKDLAGFGEPKEGAWDGWQRINFQTKAGGIFGVFRQDALETSRTVFIKDLMPDKNYVIKQAPAGNIVFKATGKEIMETGFPVQIINRINGQIFEVGIAE
jgi:alpha-galactosidase